MNLNKVQKQTDRISKFQAGSWSNRSTADQTLLLRGCIDHAKYLNMTLYFTFYDFQQCFDSMWLEDCLISLWDIGIGMNH